MSTLTSELTLYRFNPSPAKYDISVWCNKLDALLRFSGLSYKIGATRPGKGPRGKLPFVGISGAAGGSEEIVPDSENAYNELVKRGLVQDLDAGLSEHQKALTVAIAALVDQLNTLIVKER